MNVYFTENAAIEIEKFFTAYESLYFRLYDDTGLGPVENYIKNSYHESALMMKNGLLEALKELLGREQILGYAPISETCRTVTKTYGRYRVFVTYEEGLEKRTVYSVKIYRK